MNLSAKTLNRHFFRPPPGAASPAADSRRGFTLIELLMVSVVIAILASMLVAGVYIARRRAKNAQVIFEISELYKGLEIFRSRIGRGAFPPDGGYADIQGFLQAAYPRSAPDYQGQWDRWGSGDGAKFLGMNNVEIKLNQGDAEDPDDPSTRIDQAEALVFWLGGLPDPTVGDKLGGFSMAAERPLAHRNDVTQRLNMFYEFTPDRLTDYDGDGWPEFRPPITQRAAPYVYFDRNSVANPASAGAYSVQNFGVARPYQMANTGNASADAASAPRAGLVQIISAGIDNKYGTATIRYWPAMVDGDGNRLDQDQDNLTNLHTDTLGSQE